MFFSLKVSTAGEGLLVNTLMMPRGKDSVMSPVIFTMHLWRTVTVTKNSGIDPVHVGIQNLCIVFIHHFISNFLFCPFFSVDLLHPGLHSINILLHTG